MQILCKYIFNFHISHSGNWLIMMKIYGRMAWQYFQRRFFFSFFYLLFSFNTLSCLDDHLNFSFTLQNFNCMTFLKVWFVLVRILLFFFVFFFFSINLKWVFCFKNISKNYLFIFFSCFAILQMLRCVV